MDTGKIAKYTMASAAAPFPVLDTFPGDGHRTRAVCLGVAMALVVVMAVLVGAGVWVAVRLEGHMDTPATLARQSERRPSPPAAHKADTGHAGSGHVGAGRNVRCRCRDNPAHRRAGVR
ncbi:MAG TPA: hypothetical protein VGM53_08985 [Streptosporangiaceae bacterium]